MISLPTLQQLYTGIVTDLESQYGVSISPYGKVALRAIAAVQAGKLKLLYLAIGVLQKNIFVDTADSEANGGALERFGRVKLGRNPFPAVAGEYVVTVTGTAGGVINASTTWKSDDASLHPGFLFILDDAYTMVTTSDTITLRALTPGEEARLSVSDTMTVTSPIALVDAKATVTSVTVQPLAAEDLETYRQNIINSYRLEPQGGAATDYRLWSQDAQGVKNTYPYAYSGHANEINLFVEATVADSVDGHGTPDVAMLNAVEAVVEMNPNTTLPILERGRRPLGVFKVHYLPVTVKMIDVTITGFAGLTPAIQSLITTAITDAINVIRPFVSAADILLNKNDILDNNKLIGVIVTAKPGAIFVSVGFEVDSVSLASYQFVDGNIPWVNSVSFV